ncbi:hypothetical protein P3W85_22565 [Cupriavidus basilensis]|uniref:Uncharacterized protein n=1 Tax=Cupriavidus basilensis TaxID=68895 RepID=A0ABT6ASV6_9BURK|nr:hypothetical protein [Cupriavidus basilensis]MDF3835709.1 hypothetical protein [Cupriavidus basilensis]
MNIVEGLHRNTFNTLVATGLRERFVQVKSGGPLRTPRFEHERFER